MWWKMVTARQWVQGMSRLRRSSIVLLIAVGLIAGAGIVSAAEGDPAEEPSDDTLLNFGYDEDNHVFLVNTSATDSTYDCTLENGTLTAQYDPADNERIPVDILLAEDKAAVEFANRPEEKVGADSPLPIYQWLIRARMGTVASRVVWSAVPTAKSITGSS